MRRSWFPLFADCLLLGVFLALCSLPVVTAFPAFAAGCAVLREQARGGPGVTPATLLAALRRVLRSGRAILLVPTGGMVLLWLDAVALDARGPGLGVPVAATSALVAAVGLRCAAGWREGASWRTVAVSAFRSMPAQPLVPLLLAGSAFAAAALVAMSPVLLLIALGPLALAAAAVDAWRPLPPHAAVSPELSSN